MNEALYTAPIPRYDSAMPREPYNFRFDRDIMDNLAKFAETENRSRSNLIESILKAYASDKRVRDAVKMSEHPTS